MVHSKSGYPERPDSSSRSTLTTAKPLKTKQTKKGTMEASSGYLKKSKQTQEHPGAGSDSVQPAPVPRKHGPKHEVHRLSLLEQEAQNSGVVDKPSKRLPCNKSKTSRHNIEGGTKPMLRPFPPPPTAINGTRVFNCVKRRTVTRSPRGAGDNNDFEYHRPLGSRPYKAGIERYGGAFG